MEPKKLTFHIQAVENSLTEKVYFGHAEIVTSGNSDALARLLSLCMTNDSTVHEVVNASMILYLSENPDKAKSFHNKLSHIIGT